MSAGKYRTRRVATLGARAGLLSGAVGLALAACASGASSTGASSNGGSAGGDVQFDKNPYPYFWRTTPGDDVAGYTLAAYVKFATGFTRVAAVFGNDQAAQGNVPGLTAGARHLGLTIVANQAIALDQTT